MTYVTHTQRSSLNMSIAEAVYKVMQRIDDYRNYRTTLATLADLSDAQLADLGLPRRDIKRTAREAVYGADS